MRQKEIADFLELKYLHYNTHAFIESDPIQIPHQFHLREDIEISGFLTATIAWGQRKMIIRNGQRLMALMDNVPYDFIKHHTPSDLQALQNFVHRTFNFDDLCYFLNALQRIYQQYGSMEAVFTPSSGSDKLKETIINFRSIFFDAPHLPRTRKHVSDPAANSACKRLNMFLRWMVRKDDSGVDFGLWETISSQQLSCPLDVHSGRVARKLGLLIRKQNDWKAVEELDQSLRRFDPLDPVKYDFALFGLGVFERF